jgi:hypothetical protein
LSCVSSSLIPVSPQALIRSLILIGDDIVFTPLKSLFYKLQHSVWGHLLFFLLKLLVMRRASFADYIIAFCFCNFLLQTPSYFRNEHISLKHHS